jgi:uncharacterized membrane protein
MVGAAVARILGREPEQEIKADLQRFKHIMEGGVLNEATDKPRGWGRAQELVNNKLHGALG